MKYTIYTYLQPSGKRKIGCTRDYQRRVIEQQGEADVLAETEDEVFASHLEAYWKGRFQLDLDEIYLESPGSAQTDSNVLEVSLDKSLDWCTSRDFLNKDAFKRSNVTQVDFNILGVIHSLTKSQADKLVQTSKSNNNIYFSRKKIEELCEYTKQKSQSTKEDLVHTTL